jgi:hypothetical protein
MYTTLISGNAGFPAERTAAIIRVIHILTMEAIRISETSVNYNEIT